MSTSEMNLNYFGIIIIAIACRNILNLVFHRRKKRKGKELISHKED